MKKIVINNDNRRFNISSIVVGYLEENKEEVLEFEIPEKYDEYGKKACFSANGQTFAKNFDDIISNKLTITRDISQFKELDMTIEFFKIENEDEVVARTSILHILIENAIICDDDIKPDEPKIIILDKLIDEVTKVGLEVEKKGDYANLQGDYAKEQGDYAKSQGDYAKEQKIEVIKANEEANRIINNFETNVGEYTTAFNENANNKTIDFDSNAENKTSDFNQNVDNKISEYNNNASEKLSAYNTNAENKKSEFDTNVANKTKTFNDNASDKLIEYNQNDTTKTNTFNDNATNKTTEYNNNAISKVNEFNTNADNKIAEYDLHSQELDNKIVSTRNELERVKNDVLETGIDTDTFVHLEDSAMAEYQELSVDGVCEQETTTGKNKFVNKPSTLTIYGLTMTNDGETITIKGTNTSSSFYPSFIFYADGSVITFEWYGDKNKIDVSKGFFNELGNTYMLSIDKKGSVSPYGIAFILGLENSLKTVTFYNETEKYKTTINDSEKINYVCFGFKPNQVVDLTLKIQLENGSTVTEIEKYTGGQPSPSPDYPQEIKTIENSLKITSNNGELEDSENYLFSQITANLPEGEFIGKINDTYKDTLKVEYNETDGQYHLNLYKRVYKNNSYNGESYNYYISTTARKDGNIECGELQTGQVVYYDGVETIIDLGIVDMPITYNEITNLFTDSDLLPTINAKYYRNFISTVRNLQVNEKALKQELVDINNRLSALETSQTSVASESEVVE